MVQAFWVCEITSPAWKKVDGEICLLGTPVAITQVISSCFPSAVSNSRILTLIRPSATVFSDFILILSPVWIIRRVTLNQALRFRLVSAFFISIMATIAALAHSVLVIRAPGAWEAIVSLLQNPNAAPPHRFAVRGRRSCSGVNRVQRTSHYPLHRTKIQHERIIQRKQPRLHDYDHRRVWGQQKTKLDCSYHAKHR